MPRYSHPSLRSLAARALIIGVAAGLRSMTPMGVLATEHDDAPRRAGWVSWPVLRSANGRKILQLSWLGELIADKLPFTPSRLAPGALGERMVMGGLAGLAIGTEGKGATPRIVGALAGVAGALGGSYGGNYTRTFLTAKVGLPDLPGALIEDAAAFGISRKATRR